MSVNSKMTALADEIRELSGTSETIGLDVMKNHINEANSNISTEADLIAQIQSALEGKVAGSGSNLELVSVVSDVPLSGNTMACIQTLNGTELSYEFCDSIQTDGAIKGSIGVLVIDSSSDIFLPEKSDGITVIYSNENICIFVINDNASLVYEWV